MGKKKFSWEPAKCHHYWSLQRYKNINQPTIHLNPNTHAHNRMPSFLCFTQLQTHAFVSSLVSTLQVFHCYIHLLLPLDIQPLPIAPPTRHSCLHPFIHFYSSTPPCLPLPYLYPQLSFVTSVICPLRVPPHPYALPPLSDFFQRK